ncbi:MAG TPA: putative molybdenum carrier protein, partial [Myxococcota bacterium]|nr:putative molybdenum carrier protein [Myxococcota bacterium]
TGGTALAVACARRLGRPLWIHDLDAGPLDRAALRTWLAREGVARLNVAGPRESEQPGVARRVRAELEACFAEIRS